MQKEKLIAGLGKVVYESDLSERIDLKEFPKGIYFFLIENGDQSISKKLVITH